MKVIRYLAAICMIIAGLLHFYFAFNPAPPLDSAVMMVVIGILYVAIGVLILMKKRFALFLGLIPIIAIVMAPFMLDFSNLDWTFVWFPIELVAVICCLILIFKKEKG